MSKFPITLASEDSLSESLAEKIVSRHNILYIANRVKGHGFGYLKKNIYKFNAVARHAMPVLLLTDLDREECPATLIHSWLNEKKEDRLLFRIAVREAESWAMADCKSFAKFFGIDAVKMTLHPDTLPYPKHELLSLVKRSKKGILKREMLPSKNSIVPIGLGYNENLRIFIREYWQQNEAIRHSPSLHRAVQRVNELVIKLQQQIM